MYKFTLIISQFYYSRHFFIVKHEENFLNQAKEFAKELMSYKRMHADGRNLEESLGDLIYHKEDKIYPRYNVNDQGDIYFLQSDYANRLMCESWSYRDDSRREKRGQSKKVEVEISEHHDYQRVKEVVEKYFEIA